MVDTISLRERAKQLRKLADTLDEAASGLESIGGQLSLSGELTTSHQRRSSLTIQHATSPLDFDFWSWAMERFEGAAQGLTSKDFARLLEDVQRED